MLTSDDILKTLKDNMDKIKKFGVKRIGLFGSYAKNQPKEGSDIDILVEFEKGKKTFDNYMDLKFFLEDLFKCKVDLVIADALKPDLKPIILGSVIYASEA
ncbi:MAG: nucleotidyltransferase family protein [Candidatus Asgardarchaeum sp.]